MSTDPARDASPLLRHFIWYMRASARNRLRVLLSRVKSPRYAIAMLLGGAYFVLVFIMPLFMHGEARRAQTGGGIVSLARSAGPLFLAVLAASWWLWRTDSDAISLSPAEANLLVPAPLSRRQLIQFKLLGSQPGIMTSSLFITLLTHASTLPWMLRFLATWIMFTTLQLHRYGASLVHTSLVQQGRSGWKRVWPAALMFAAVFGAIAFSIFTSLAGDGGTSSITFTRVTNAIARPPASIALTPFRAVMAAVNATTVNAWTGAFAIAVAIVIAHYFWVVSMDAAFEEGAAAAGARRAQVVEAMRSGKSAWRAASAGKKTGPVRPAWFPLRSTGDPAVAVLWKNMLAVTRGVSKRALTTVAGIIVFMLIMISTGEKGKGDSGPGILEMIGVLMVSYGFMATFMAPIRVRHDYRNDLRKLELMRTLPVGGSTLAAAQITTSTVVVSILQLGLLGVGLACMIGAGIVHPEPLHYALAIPALFVLFAMNATMVVIHNGIAILFPAWTNQKPGGVEMFGLAMITMIGSLLLFVFSLIAPLIVGGIAGVSMAAQWGTRAYIPALAGVVVGLYVQLLLLTLWLGRAYDRMDPTDRGGILT